jgi:predicted DNA-binding transcriptional regulator YafY
VWKFTPEVAADAKEFVFHPTQKIAEQPDGSLVVRFRAGGGLEMCWHLFTWGGHLSILGPKRLHKLLNGQLHRVTAANSIVDRAKR